MFNRAIPCVYLLLFLAPYRDAWADKKSDFEEAVKNDGCEAIPYSTLRSRCIDRRSDVRDWCKTDKWNCDSGELGVGKLADNIERLKGKIESLKSELDNWKSKRSAAKDDNEKREAEDKISEIERKIYELNGKIDEHKNRIEANKKELRDRIYQGEKCRDYRKDVQEVFKDAKSQAKGESDPDIRPLANQLVDKYERGERTHDDQIEDVKKGISKCKDKLEGRD